VATDSDGFAAELIPTSYASWRYCIEVKCGLPLTLDFVRERIRILSDPSQEETARFMRSYGHGHLERVLGWFRQAADALASGAGAKAAGTRQTGP
jgi:hypothetical protein